MPGVREALSSRSPKECYKIEDTNVVGDGCRCAGTTAMRTAAAAAETMVRGERA
jgi:hypothetical protein